MAEPRFWLKKARDHRSLQGVGPIAHVVAVVESTEGYVRYATRCGRGLEVRRVGAPAFGVTEVPRGYRLCYMCYIVLSLEERAHKAYQRWLRGELTGDRAQPLSDLWLE